MKVKLGTYGEVQRASAQLLNDGVKTSLLYGGREPLEIDKLDGIRKQVADGYTPILFDATPALILALQDIDSDLVAYACEAG